MKLPPDWAYRAHEGVMNDSARDLEVARIVLKHGGVPRNGEDF
jgi:hypothetical protein